MAEQHLAVTDAQIREMAPEIAAAYRRAAPVPDEALDFTLVEYTQDECEVLHGVEVDSAVDDIDDVSVGMKICHQP